MIKNVYGNTLDHLGAAIVSGRYPSGATIPPEPLLGAELGVSRTVIREAVKSLIGKGLVSTGPKVGTRVLASEHWNWFDPDVVTWQARAGLTREFLRELQELRRVVEPAAVRLAAERATAQDILEIEAAFDGMRRAVEEGGDYVACDLRFHQGLLRACGNRMMIQMSKAIGALLRTSFEISTSRQDGAVITRNPAKAERAVLVLIAGAGDDIDAVLASRRRLPRLDTPARLLPETRERVQARKGPRVNRLNNA